MSSITVSPKSGLQGTISIPGDKSISHRAAMMGALAQGETRIEGFLMSEDCLNTVKILEAMGIEIKRSAPNTLVIHGKGLNGLQEPDCVLDAGNSGTTMRLMSGILSAQSFFSVITGDASLLKRPMAGIIKPLSTMGAKIWARAKDSLPPLAIKGMKLKSISYKLPFASDQIKSAILLAGLWVNGECEVMESGISSDHTERMFRHFGILCKSKELKVSMEGGKRFKGHPYVVPGDFSTAASFIAASLITKGSDLIIKNVGLNPTRTKLLDVLGRMGAKIEILERHDASGEPVADLRCCSSDLHGVKIGGKDVPRVIDEFPILFLAATQAEGDTIIKGAREFRFKESDSITAMAKELRNIGAKVDELADGIIIKGGQRLKGGFSSSHGDHRIAVTMAVAGLVSKKGTIVQDWRCVNTTFPDFLRLLESL